MFESNRSITMTPVTANLINQNRFVAIVTAGEVDESIAAGESIGVSLEESIVGASAVIPVSLLDGSKVEVEAGATVVAGASIASDSVGRAVTATATDSILGYAITGAAINEIITIVASKAAGLAT